MPYGINQCSHHLFRWWLGACLVAKSAKCWSVKCVLLVIHILVEQYKGMLSSLTIISKRFYSKAMVRKHLGLGSLNLRSLISLLRNFCFLLSSSNRFHIWWVSSQLSCNGICQISMVSCQKGPTRHAYSWQIGPFWQDTINIWQGSHAVLISWKSTYFWSWVLRSWKSP